jgi:hypothetical protein
MFRTKCQGVTLDYAEYTEDSDDSEGSDQG